MLQDRCPVCPVCL